MKFLLGPETGFWFHTPETGSGTESEAGSETGSMKPGLKKRMFRLKQQIPSLGFRVVVSDSETGSETGYETASGFRLPKRISCYIILYVHVYTHIRAYTYANICAIITSPLISKRL